MKKVLMILVCVFSFTLTSCETLKGVGQDIQKAGKALEKKATE